MYCIAKYACLGGSNKIYMPVSNNAGDAWHCSWWQDTLMAFLVILMLLILLSQRRHNSALTCYSSIWGPCQHCSDKCKDIPITFYLDCYCIVTSSLYSDYTHDSMLWINLPYGHFANCTVSITLLITLLPLCMPRWSSNKAKYCNVTC